MRSTAMTAGWLCNYVRPTLTVIMAEDTHVLLKAPKSANNASTPVKASRIPPRDLQPSVLLRLK